MVMREREAEKGDSYREHMNKSHEKPKQSFFMFRSEREKKKVILNDKDSIFFSY